MNISLMILIAAALLTAGGIGERTLYKIGINKRNALIFFLGAAAMNGLIIEPNDEMAISAACVYITVFTFGYSYAEKSEVGHRILLIPISVFIGAMSGMISDGMNVIPVLAPAALSIIFGTGFGIASGGLIPVLDMIAAFIRTAAVEGYGFLSIGEECLVYQLSAVIISVFIKILFPNIRTIIRQKLYERTNKSI